MKEIYITKNNGKTVIPYSAELFDKNKELLEEEGYKIVKEDLTEIKGVTKKIAEKLYNEGITTIDQVADMDIGDHGIKQESIVSALEIIRNNK